MTSLTELYDSIKLHGIGTGDTRSETELQDQISKLSDKTLKQWNKEFSNMKLKVLSSKINKLQQKMVDSEMKSRKLN